MTRYEYAMQQAGDAATENYLRDLKASHDALLEAGKMYMERVAIDIESNHELDALYAMNAALKAAEALR